MSTIEKKSKEELKAEALELAAKLDKMNSEMAEIEKAEREQAEKEARVKAEKAAEQARIDHVEIYMGVAQQLVQLLKGVGFASAKVIPTEQHKDDFPVIRVTPSVSSDCDYSVFFEYIYNKSSWKATKKGVRLVVGDFGTKRYFPKKADGTFSLDKLVVAVKERYDNRLAENKRNREQEKNLNASKSIKLALMKRFSKLSTYTWRKNDPSNPEHYEDIDGVEVTASQYSPNKVKITVDWHPELTEAEATEFVRLVTQFKAKVDQRVSYEREQRKSEEE